MSDGQLKYRALADQLRRGIVAGSWLAGEQLPTQQVLADQRGISVSSVRRAVDLLVDEGLVERVQGSGTFVRPTRRYHGPAAVVGVLVPDVQLYFPRVLAGIESVLQPRGVIVRTATYDNEAHREADALDRLCRSGVDAVLLSPSEPTNRLIDCFELPVALLERRLLVDPMRDRIDHVRSDHRAGGADAVEHLLALGHTRIGLLLRDQPATSQEVARGYHWAMAEHGLRTFEWRAPMNAWPTISAEVAAWLVAEGVTAVLAVGDQEAISVQQAALASGLRVPQDLAMVSYDDELAAGAVVPLTAVAPSKFRLGRAAGHLIWDRLSAGGHAPVQHVTVRPSMVVRRSCGTKPQRPSSSIKRS